MPDIQALTYEQHHQVKILDNPCFLQSKTSHLTPAYLIELPDLQAEYPLVLIKDNQTGQFNLVALLGLKPAENLFHNDKGWQARHIPLHLQIYPFALGSKAGDEQCNPLLCLDMDCELVNHSHGQALFDQQGQQTAFLQHKVQLMELLTEQQQLTREFIQVLVGQRLIHPKSLTINKGTEQEYDLNGLYVIDETALQTLDSQTLTELRDKGWLPYIYAIMFSGRRVANLLQL